MTDLPSLIAAVEAASGPDREIDAMVAVHLGMIDEREAAIGFRLDKSGETKMVISPKVSRFTASIDAVVALIRREMPGVEWSLHGGGETSFVFFEPDERPEHEPDEAPTEALALLLAFLRAVQAKQMETTP